MTWTPEWQREAQAVLAGELSVGDLADRRMTSRHSGVTYESNSTITAQEPYEPSEPMLYGRQDMADVSTCTDLVATPEVIWDVNGYYKAIGVPFPHRPVARASLLRAHLAAGGLDRRWPTYALKQLLDPQKRAEYDRMPLGQPYIDDYWNEWLHNKATREAYRRVAAGELQVDEVDSGRAAENIMREEWGIKMEDDTAASPPRPFVPSPPTKLTWSYYLWRCSFAATRECLPKLDEWRTLLVEAFRDRAMRLTFRVGIMGKQPHPWVRQSCDGNLVFFLNKDQDPTKEYAAQAAQFTQRELSGHTDTVTIQENRNGIA
jgi:hypothetical protein